MTELRAAVCWPCVVGLHEECLDTELIQPEEPEDAMVDDRWEVRCCCKSKLAPLDLVDVEKRGVGRPISEPGDITDVTSTGRKRAALMYPIFDGMICEWAGLKFAGGGIKPVIGCDGNLLYAERGKYGRHHGPNKSVLENNPANVHRICMTCHNRWHALNNEFYGERPAADQPYLPDPKHGECLKHDPDTMATDEERDINEARWAQRKTERIDSDD